jgi:type II secretory pathway pseudopilin PulG
MAISPIDLQTLFTQVDKIGRQETAQKSGAAIQQAIQQAQSQRLTEEKIRSVNEAPDQGEGAEGVRDRNGRKAGREAASKRKASEEAKDETGADTDETGVIRDPNLGRNIDVSL